MSDRGAREGGKVSILQQQQQQSFLLMRVMCVCVFVHQRWDAGMTGWILLLLLLHECTKNVHSLSRLYDSGRGGNVVAAVSARLKCTTVCTQHDRTTLLATLLI